MSALDDSPFLPPEIEGLLERFEVAWHGGTVPDLRGFLPGALPDGQPLTGSVRRALLCELVKVDLEYRWRGAREPAPCLDLLSPTHSTPPETGRPLPLRPLLESYVAAFPELGSLECLPLSLIGEEYRVRQRWGDRPDRTEYQSRFTAHKESLGHLLTGLDAELAAEHLHPSRAISPLRSTRAAGCDIDSRSPPAPDPVRPPVPCLGRYRLDALLGRGSFGSVWRAWDTELGRAVALKLPHAGRFADTPEEERFLREARSTARLHHPGIVAVHDVGRDGDTVYMVSELVLGVSLEAWLKDGRPTCTQVAELIASVAEALHYAHQQGVVHRDVKPSNILLAVGEQPPAPGQPVPALCPRVMDFGLAKREAGEALLTREGQLLGTPAYMSPEQIRDPRAVDGRSDVYSLGVVLYELLTGTLPFDGVTRMVLHQVLTEEPRPLRRLNDRVPRDLETITLTCLAKDPARRYPTAQALADDLRRFRAGEPIQARPVPWWERALKWARRRPAWAALIGVSVLAVISLLGGSLWYNARLQAALREADRQRELAERERDRAAEGFRQAREAVDEYFTRVSESRLLNRDGLQPLRKELLEAALRYYREFLRQHGDDPSVRAELAATYVRVGWITSVIGSRDEALAAYHRGRELFSELAEADPGHTGWQEQLGRIYKLVSILERERGQLVEALRWAERALALQKRLADADPASRRWAFDRACSYHARGTIQREIGQLDAALRDFEEARVCFERSSPSEFACRSALGFTWLCLGDVYEQNQQLTRALRAYQQGHELFERLARESSSDIEIQQALATACAKLGGILEARCQRAEALRWHEQARDLQERLLQANPSVAEWRAALARTWFTLGRLHSIAGRATEARRCYERAGELVTELLRGNPSGPRFQELLAARERTVGQMLQQAGRPDEALRYLERTRAELEKLQEDNPAVPAYSIALARTWTSLGRLHVAAQRSADARRCLEQGCVVGEKLVRACPALVQCQHDLAINYMYLAEQHDRAGQREPAVRSLERARAIQERLVESHPEVPLFRNALAGCACLNLANWYREANRADEARSCLERALQLQEELVQTNPEEPCFKGDLAIILLAVGNRHVEAGQPAAARGCAERARTLLEELMALPTAPDALRRQLGRGFRTLGLLHSQVGLREEAVRSLSAARDVEEGLLGDHPDSPAFLGSLADTCADLGRLQQGLGQLAEALRSFERCCELAERLSGKQSFGPTQRSKLGQGWGRCGQILQQQGRLGEARRSYERAILHLGLATVQAPAVAAYWKQLGEHCGLLASVLREMGHPLETAEGTSR
jgi:tetratricopeptide (TPR) repeat protein